MEAILRRLTRVDDLPKEQKMTFEEIQQTIQGMLEVQRELQQTQIKQSEEIRQLIEGAREQDKRIEQLIGYSISQAGDVMDVQIALRGIYARLSQLEDKLKKEEE